MMIVKINKIFFSLLLVGFSQTLLAQEEKLNVVKPEIKFDRWSIEANIGQNKAIRPFSAGYYTSDPTVYFNFSGIDHFDLGLRYMFTSHFGLKLDVGYDVIKDQDGSGSLPFETNQYRVGLQGVANLARVFNFESFSSKIGLLAHAGIQVAQVEPQMGVNKGKSEQNGGLMIGLTPQYKIANWLALTGDFSIISNLRQHYNWDGTYSAESNNLSGLMYNTSLGFTFYLGSKKQHADWYIETAGTSENDTALKRISDLEAMLHDTDKDGVPDYLDIENNTPSGVAVDSKGRFFDKNKNGTPDELEPRNGLDGSNNKFVSKSDAVKMLVEKGFVNVFFDVNEDNPNSGSTNNVYYIINFLREYPDAKAKLIGYADVRGNEKNNKDLSKRRAQKLYDIIIASGVNANRISISGEGVDTTFPKTKTGLDLARRVSIILE